MKQRLLIGLLAAYLTVLCASMSALALPGGRQGQSGEPFKELWLKLWNPDGEVLDMRVRILPVGAMAMERAAAKEPSPLSSYPFQFDVSSLGDLAGDEIRGIVYGFKIGSAGRPESPLMIRWWVVKRGQPDPEDPAPARYSHTLKLRVWDPEGVEFDPDRHMAHIFPTLEKARASYEGPAGPKKRLPLLF